MSNFSVTCKLFPYRFSRRNLALTAFLKSTKLLTCFQSFALLLIQLYHALLGQLVNFISELLQPLTQNEYTLKDTFDPANRIKAISPALFAEGYEFVSMFLSSGHGKSL